MQAQRASIEHHINKIGARGESITQNVENIKRMIHERCELAMLEAERLGQEKVRCVWPQLLAFLLLHHFLFYYYFLPQLTRLLGDDIELRRQLCEIDALQAFLEYQRSSFDGVQHLLVNWKTHNRLVADTKNTEPLNSDIQVKSDLRVSSLLPQ